VSADSTRRPVLVTGGGGLLGVSVVAHLRAAGYSVAILDDASGGTNARLDEFEADHALRLYRVDLRNRAALVSICERDPPLAIIHLAGRHFIPYCEAHEHETWEVNVNGTQSIVEAALRCHPRRLIFASTADVYRESTTAHRETDPLGPRTVYGRSKLSAERILQQSSSASGIDTVIARLFNLYGARHTVDHLIPTLLSQAAATDALSLGDLTTVRDFVYVEDAAAALVALLSTGPTGIYNVGTGVGTSGATLVRLVSTLLGRRLTASLDPRRLRDDNRRTLVSDPTKLKRLLPWWPATSVQEGLRALIDGTAPSGPPPQPDTLSVGTL
jgi:UDP-glucose 4-epimerase